MRLHRLAIAACLALAACASRDEAVWHDEPGYRWRALTITRGTDGFTSIAPRQSGIRFQNAASEKILLGNRVLGQGGGVSLGDVDGDGRDEIILGSVALRPDGKVLWNLGLGQALVVSADKADEIAAAIDGFKLGVITEQPNNLDGWVQGAKGTDGGAVRLVGGYRS